MLCTVLLALTPVVLDQFRAEVARWYLADATNKVVNKQPVTGQIEKAAKWVDDLTELRDYWLYRTEEAYVSSPKAVAAVIASAVHHDPSNYYLGALYSQRMADDARFAEAVEVLKASHVGSLSPQDLNQLAYFRALASIELEDALADINLALEAPNISPLFQAMLRDTRAWVLYRLQKPDKAIDDINFAIEEIEKLEPSGAFDQSLEWLASKLNGGVDSTSSEHDHVLTKREVGEWQWTLGTLRYHRAKILEALDKRDAAEADLQWLREHHLPQDDRLF